MCGDAAAVLDGVPKLVLGAAQRRQKVLAGQWSPVVEVGDDREAGVPHHAVPKARHLAARRACPRTGGREQNLLVAGASAPPVVRVEQANEAPRVATGRHEREQPIPRRHVRKELPVVVPVRVPPRPLLGAVLVQYEVGVRAAGAREQRAVAAREEGVRLEPPVKAHGAVLRRVHCLPEVEGRVHIVVPLQVRVASLVRIADRAIEKGGDLWQAPPHNRGCPQARPGLGARGSDLRLVPGRLAHRFRMEEDPHTCRAVRWRQTVE
mmetsp:Transcript_38732/g.115174  ORF Transcript_38732/g.115174 Transcript_38732/m.115174 type:complete len:265 (-) Transcript_38732:224-1018(-)